MLSTETVCYDLYEVFVVDQFLTNLKHTLEEFWIETTSVCLFNILELAQMVFGIM